MGSTTIRLTGRLQQHARTAVGTDGSAWLWVEIGQARGLIAATARRGYGAGATAQLAASNAARQLRAGSLVCIHASGWRLAGSPSPHLELLGVELIEQLEHFYPNEPAAETRLSTA